MSDLEKRVKDLETKVSKFEETAAAAVQAGKASTEHARFVIQFTKHAGWMIVVAITLAGVLLGAFGFASIRDVRNITREIEEKMGPIITGKEELTDKLSADFLTALELQPDEELDDETKRRLREYINRFEVFDALGFELDAEAYSAAGKAYYLEEDYERAVDSYGIAIKNNPNDAITYNGKGAALVGLGDRAKHPQEKHDKYRKALAFFNSAVHINPDFARAYMNKGYALLMLGSMSKEKQGRQMYEEALDSFQRALDHNPDFAVAHSNKSFALRKLGNLMSEETQKEQKRQMYAESLASSNRAIEIKPDFFESYFNKGSALILLGDRSKGAQKKDFFEKALASFNRALQIKPDSADTFYHRAYVHLSLNKPREALADLRKAIEPPSKFREMARNDPSFNDLHEDLEFRKLVGLEEEKAK